MKSKPTQYASRTLNETGLQADFILARSEEPIDEPRRRKLSVFCNIDAGSVISSPDVPSIYLVPGLYEEQQLGEKILKKLHLKPRKNEMKEWIDWANQITTYKDEVKIGVLGKYFSTGSFVLSDVYISVIEAIKHAAWANHKKPCLTWLNSEDYEQDPKKVSELAGFDGIVIPGGFGNRGVEGKITAIKYIREHKIPYLGLCYGMQLATVEYARNVAGMKDANTTEINPKTPYPVIHIMPEQEKKLLALDYGGTMRLGAYPCVLKKGTKSYSAYTSPSSLPPSPFLISERHRHRYEFNNQFRDQLEGAGLTIAGTSPDGKIVEVIELKDHPFFVASQFHPEFKSQPQNPHPLFREFIKAAIKERK